MVPTARAAARPKRSRTDLKGESTAGLHLPLLPHQVLGHDGDGLRALAHSAQQVDARLSASSKKGVSANQLSRSLDVTYGTAWFMAHRIREAMADKSPAPMGGEGKYVEADETYVGGKETNKKVSKRKPGQIGGVGKQVVFSLVERGGRARSFHVANVTGATLAPILRTQVHRTSTLMTDEAGQYRNVGTEFVRHGTVNRQRRIRSR